MFPVEKRHRAVVHYKYFLRSLRKVAGIYGVSKSTLSRWVSASIEGSIDNTYRKKRIDKVTPITESVADLLNNNSFLTLDEMVRHLKDMGYIVSRSTVCRAVRLSGYTRKRVRPVFKPKHPSTSDTQKFMDSFQANDNRISVDETCIYIQESPRYGYSKVGERCIHRRNYTRRHKRITLLLAISDTRGVLGSEVFKGSANADSFSSFIGSLPGVRDSTLILDNVSFHRSAIVKNTATEKNINLLYIPPYSPDFNPIENAFSVLKSALRKRDPVELEKGLSVISTEKCKAFFRRTEEFASNILKTT